MNQINLTNHELIQELEKRVQNGTLKVQITPEQFEKRTESLFSYLDSKNLLLLVGLTVGLTFLVCYSLKITTSSPTRGSLEFSDQESKIT